MTVTFDLIIKALRRQLESPDVVTMPNGAVLIGHLPAVGPSAFLHTVFPAKGDADLKAFETEFDLALPAPVRAFLAAVNGMVLFQGALSLYGIRTTLSRNAASREPFSIAERNIARRPIDAHRDDFFLGSYNYDGSLLFICDNREQVYRRPANERVKLNVWPGISAMLDSELERIGQLFDETGRERNPEIPTTPSINT